MTSLARHSLCSYTSQPRDVSLAEQELIHSGLSGQPSLHMSPESRDGLPLDPASPSAATRCTPISAHALSVSAETKGLDDTSFEATTGSLIRKRARQAANTSTVTFQQVDAVRRRTLSHGSRQGQAPSKGPSHIFCKILVPNATAGHCNPRDFKREASSQWPALVGVLQAL